MIRSPSLEDVDDIAAVHVAAWRETYTGLLPDAEIAARSLPVRQAQWRAQISAANSRIAYLPGLGFAQMGPQRAKRLLPDWPEELYCLYLLQSAHGTGQGAALLRAVRGLAAFSVVVLSSNARARRFYEKSGGRFLFEEAEHLGETQVTDVTYGFDNA